MIEKKEITKPVVAWCIGTINEQISGEVQFGHAGAKSNKDEETASYKNKRLAEAGAIVPQSFIDFGDKVQETFDQIGVSPREEIDISMRYHDIKNRKKTSFTSTISDERGEELIYNGRKISEFTKDPNIGKVIGHLWLKKELPDYACNFLNTVIVLIADHGPAVAGATNAITTSRAGNDIKSSLISGLATIGSRFG